MKNYLILLFFTLFLQKADAQITLSQSTYPLSVLGTDTLKKTMAGNTFPSLLPSTNASWDMSALIDTMPVYYAYRVASTSNNYADSSTYNLSSYTYQGNAQIDIASIGILEYAIKIFKKSVSLFPHTGISTDSLFVLSQNMFYSSQLTKISFPTTYGTSWYSDYYSTLNLQVSINSMSYNHSPGYLRRHTIEKDSVTGWGKMRVKDLAGMPSSWFNVLQVQSIIFTQDSFFLNGSPFTVPLLLSLQLTQGAKTTTYKQNYYRLGEVTPLESVLFTDSTFTHPYSAMTHTQRLVNVGVDEIVENPVVVYPNPVKGNIINVQLPITTITWAYELVDISGKIIISGLINNHVGDGEITLPKDIKQGNYVLRIGNGKDLNYNKEITLDR